MTYFQGFEMCSKVVGPLPSLDTVHRARFAELVPLFRARNGDIGGSKLVMTSSVTLGDELVMLRDVASLLENPLLWHTANSILNA